MHEAADSAIEHVEAARKIFLDEPWQKREWRVEERRVRPKDAIHQGSAQVARWVRQQTADRVIGRRARRERLGKADDGHCVCSGRTGRAMSVCLVRLGVSRSVEESQRQR